MSSRIWISLFAAFIGYSIVVYIDSGQSKASTPTESIKNGWATWQNKNCQSCHQIYGLGGYMGPDLTNAISVRDTEYLKTLIRYGSGRMPNFKLSEKEVTNLVAFLAWVNESGNGSVPETSVHWSGTYIIDR